MIEFQVIFSNFSQIGIMHPRMSSTKKKQLVHYIYRNIYPKEAKDREANRILTKANNVTNSGHTGTYYNSTALLILLTIKVIKRREDRTKIFKHLMNTLHAESYYKTKYVYGQYKYRNLIIYANLT